MSEKIDEGLETIVKRILRVSEVRDEMSMKNIPTWDSLKHVELISELEEAFHINVEIEDVMHMTDIKGVFEVNPVKYEENDIKALIGRFF